MTINFHNNPIEDVISAAMELYPGTEAIIYFDEDVETPGVTIFPDDGSTPLIGINPDIPYRAVVEIIAHELAHIIAGYDAGHGEKWEAVFDEIHKRYSTEAGADR